MKQINKNMKNIILTTMILVLALGVTAQDTKKERKGKKGNGEYAWMKENLDLSDAQKAQLDSINKSLRSEVKTMREMDKKAKREKSKALREKKTVAYNTVLSSDQIAKLEAHRAEKKAENAQKRKEKIEAKDPNAEASKKVEELKSSIGLTPEQEPAVKEAFVNFFTSKKEIALMPSDSEGDKEARKAKSKEVSKSLRSSLKEVLSKEQLDKMKTERKAKRDKKER